MDAIWPFLAGIRYLAIPGRDHETARRENAFVKFLALTLAEDGVDEGGRVERGQVVGPLAEADQLDRNAQLALHGEYISAQMRAFCEQAMTLRDIANKVSAE